MKTILLPYHDEAAARSALHAAIVLAKRFDAHLEGLLVQDQPQLAFGSMMPGMAIPAAYLSAAADEWRHFADGARSDFLKITREHGLPFREIEAAGDGATAGWREVEGRESVVVGEHGRVFDLIVIGRSDATPTARWRDTCEAALFESGRPVLLAPVEAAATIGRTIALAWNGSVESARSVALGLPLLLQAERVEVLGVQGNMVAGPGGAEVVAYLRRHGIAAFGRMLEPAGRPAGEAILEEAGDIGADLVMKGAFTRNRFRQIIFGGTTQHILDHARLPVLFVH